MPKGKPGPLPARGYLLHISHYDPVWYAAKKKERPFDPDCGRKVVDALADEGFNLLVVDIEDAVAFPSHPELRKHYTHPISMLRDLASYARGKGLDVVPKLNFSKSCGHHHHDDWSLPPDTLWNRNYDGDAYWKKGFEIIDDVVKACKPGRYFHIGMDEDHDRSYDHYVKAIKTLRAGLRKRKLRTIMWNDGAIGAPHALIHRDKAIYAMPRIPKDVIQVIWTYHRVPTRECRAIRENGLELWGAPGFRDLAIARRFRDTVKRLDGRGLLVTRWIPCTKQTVKELCEIVRTMGPVVSG